MTFPVTASLPPPPKPRKSLGQHFLTDARVLSRIVAAVELAPEDTVVEIGPGRGALTCRLVGRAGRVVAVELDRELAADLPTRCGQPANLAVVEADARTVEIDSLLAAGVKEGDGDSGGSAYKVVGNLPYYAANPIIRRFLEADPGPRLMVMMVQREVADSMTAAPGRMSLLSVATQFYAAARLVCTVPPTAFRPAPKVTSAVVRLDLRPVPAAPVSDSVAFFDLVRAGFSAPRKQLRNSLGQGLGLPAGLAGETLAAAGVDGRRRAETLSLEEWAAVFDSWQDRAPEPAPVDEAEAV